MGVDANDVEFLYERLITNAMPPVHILLRETILQVYSGLPKGAADLRFNPNKGWYGPAIDVDIIPSSTRASSISAHAEEGGQEAVIGFGRNSRVEIRYQKHTDADQIFKEEIATLCRIITTNHWQERVVLRGDRIASSAAVLPLPFGRVRAWDFSSLFLWVKKTEMVIDWEPYVCKEHGVPEKRSPV